MNTVTIYYNTDVMTGHQPPRGMAIEEPARIVGIEALLKGHDPLAIVGEWRKSNGTSIISIPVKELSLWSKCRIVKATEISNAEVESEYGMKAVRNAAANTPKVGSRISSSCPDIYWSEGTWRAAKAAAGAAVMAAKAYLSGSEGHAFCIVRPPGHHCMGMPAGFCILNNVVFAARRLIAEGKRIAIVDWDYHFGDGTAAALWGEESVMFVSLHAAMGRDGRQTYPMRTARNLKGVGLCEQTRGRSFNIQWDQDNADDAAYAYAFQQLLIPALERFAPDVILISAGYDAIRGDTLAGMELTPGAFRYMAAALSKWPVIAILEGGYDVALLAEGVAETIQGLLHAPPDLDSWLTRKGEFVQPEHRRVIEEIRSYVLGFQAES